MAWVITAGQALIFLNGTRFICEPLVPWRISTALFGDFFAAWMIAAIRSREGGVELEPLLRLCCCGSLPFMDSFMHRGF
jgi:hypothetical protein